MIEPVGDYVYGQAIEEDTGVITNSDITDTKQKYQVLAVGDGKWEHGVFRSPRLKAGDIVYIQKHAAEGDTPPDMYAKGYALFMESRVMAIEKEGKV